MVTHKYAPVCTVCYLCCLLKGGFAKCYELTDSDTKQILAGKIVPKSLLVKPHQKEKVTITMSCCQSFFNLNCWLFVTLFSCQNVAEFIVSIGTHSFGKYTQSFTYEIFCKDAVVMIEQGVVQMVHQQMANSK